MKQTGEASTLKMTKILAIQIGSHASTICVGDLSTKTPEIITNEDGDRSIPSYLAYSGDDILIGSLAYQQLYRNPQNTLSDFVRYLIGNEGSKPKSAKIGYTLTANENGQLCYEISSSTDYDNPSSTLIRPIDAFVEFIRQLKRTAEGYTGAQLELLSLSVPINFTPAEVSEVKSAISQFGMRLLNIVYEPVAILYALDLLRLAGAEHVDQSESDRPVCENVLVVDSGLHQTTATLLALRSSSDFAVVVKKWQSEEISGKVIDRLLLDFAADEFQRKFRMDLRENRRSVMKMMVAVENAKKTLSNAQTAFITADSVHDGLDFSLNLHRLKFETLINNAVQSFYKFLMDCKAEISSSLGLAVSKVIFVGGNSKIVKFQEVMQSVWAESVLKLDQNVNELPALGACLEAAYRLNHHLTMDPESSQNHHLATRDVFVQIATGNDQEEALMVQLLDQYHPLPFIKDFTIKLPQEQESFILQFLEKRNSEKLNLLSELELHNDKTKAIELKLTLNAQESGQMSVKLTEVHSRSSINIDL